MPSRVGFRNNLERDVYQILNKLDTNFTTVSAAYDAIKRSNSSIARLKKRPLEDAIDRVLQIRKQEAQDDESDDSGYYTLTAKQRKRLAHHQKKLAKSHSFYKPEETFTHHPFPFGYLMAVIILLDCHRYVKTYLLSRQGF